MSEYIIRLLIADDHSIVREGLTAMLMGQPDIDLVGMAANGSEAVALVRDLQPDVVLLDLVMPRMDGLTALQTIKHEHPNTRIVILTSFADDERIFTAIRAGALGYLLKDTSHAQLLEAIRDAARGQAFLHPMVVSKMMHGLSQETDQPSPPSAAPSDIADDLLTERELETLRLLARGLSNHEIACALNLHERTIAKYVGSILEKLHLKNRTQAALYALRHGIESPG
jgi:NarL family two-component system response regulator LiaR